MLLIFMLLPVASLRCGARAILLPAAGALSFVQLGDLSLADYTRSYADDLSIIGVLWLLSLGVGRVLGRSLVSSQHQFQLALFMVVLGAALYPATLGLSVTDPYRLGFSPRALMVMLFVICLVWWWLRNYFAMLLVTLATTFYLIDIKASDNYWDYLIDPLLWFLCLGYVALQLWRRLALARSRAAPRLNRVLNTASTSSR